MTSSGWWKNDATPSLNNNTLTPNPQAVFPSDFEILFQSLEDKLNGKILPIKPYLLDEVNDLKNELKVLQDNYLRENSESNEKEKICALKQKVKCVENIQNYPKCPKYEIAKFCRL